MKTMSQVTETLLNGIDANREPQIQQEVTISINAPLKPQQEGITEQKTPISEDLQGKKKLTRLVTACYEGLNIYGKSPEQLEAIIMLMQMTLKRFPYEIIKSAFEIYLEKGSVMPTPADIIKTIEPPQKEQVWCGATYIQLCKRKRENQFMLDAELKYIKDFENARITAPEQQRGLIDDTMRQVEQENKQYRLE
jgi:hypothetical protein